MKAFVVLSFICVSLFSRAAVFTIISGGNNGSSLRNYIQLASPGDTIYIDKIILGFTLDSLEIVLDKPISIIGKIYTQYIERNSVAGTPDFRIFRFINSGNVYLKNLQFSGGLTETINHQPQYGGAIFISDTNCHVHLDSCIIKSNAAASGKFVTHPTIYELPLGGSGGGICNYGKLTITSCQFQNNVAGNGGVAYYVKSIGPEFDCYALQGGSGGAIANYYYTNISSSIFELNKAGNGGYFELAYTNQYCCENGGSGGAIYNDMNATLEVNNCLIYRNASGSAIHCNAGAGSAIDNFGLLNILNSTISDQYPSANTKEEVEVDPENFSLKASLNCSWQSTTHIFNSILYNNTGGTVQDIAVADSNSISINYSLVGKINWVILTGNGNLKGIDPEFASPDNYHILFNSPCINNGNADSSTLEFDLDGNPRIIENNIDIGAFEFQGLTNVLYKNNLHFEIAPNPSNGSFTLNTRSIPLNEIYEMAIFDITGNLVYNTKVNPNQHDINVNLQDKICPGIYIINLKSSKFQVQKKLIIR